MIVTRLGAGPQGIGTKGKFKQSAGWEHGSAHEVSMNNAPWNVKLDSTSVRTVQSSDFTTGKLRHAEG